MNKEYEDYLKSKEWKSLRLRLFKLRGKKCEKCPATLRLQIHHITYERIFKELDEDLLIVCRKCHEEIHGIEPVKKKTKKTIQYVEGEFVRKTHERNKRGKYKTEKDFENALKSARRRDTKTHNRKSKSFLPVKKKKSNSKNYNYIAADGTKRMVSKQFLEYMNNKKPWINSAP